MRISAMPCSGVAIALAASTMRVQKIALHSHPAKRCMRSNVLWYLLLIFGCAKITMPMKRRRRMYVKTNIGMLRSSPFAKLMVKKMDRRMNQNVEHIPALECTPPNSKILVRMRRIRRGVLLGVAAKTSKRKLMM